MPVRRLRRLLAALATAALVLAACGSGSGPDSGDGAVATDSDQAPAAGQSPDAEGLLGFTASAVDGTTVDVGAYAGSDLVIWFWAPW